MQHVICIKWSADNKYILSGSDEMNIRLWKANAAEKLGVVSAVLFQLLFFCFYGFIMYATFLAAVWLISYYNVYMLINSCVFLSCQICSLSL